MNLNADILFDFLIPVFPIIRYGSSEKRLHIMRPEFYNGESCRFESNHLYISLADRLPDNPQFGKCTTIVCVGGYPPAWYMEGRCNCMVVKDSADIFSVFNHVQALFNMFDEWDSRLNEILSDNADIGEMVKLTSRLMGLPLIVLDRKFKYLACSEENSFSGYKPDGTIDLDNFSKAMENYKIDLTTNIPFIMNLDPLSLCNNLFDKRSNYIGSVTALATTRDLRPSDHVLINHFAKVLEKAITRLPEANDDRLGNLKSIFSDLLQGLPGNPKRLRVLENYKQNSSFACVKFEPSGKMQTAPLAFVAGMVESSIPNAIAIPYETGVIAYIELCGDLEDICSMITEFAGKMELKLGISEAFSDLMLARIYYRQASIALEFGKSLNPDKNVLKFSDYRLFYLLSHSTGEFPLDILIPQGLKQIYEKDKQSSTDYMQTLKLYLDNNMNVSKTASELFLHRSSLMDRLKRIEKYLAMDLEDPDQRLMLQLLLRTAEFNELITNQYNN